MDFLYLIKKFFSKKNSHLTFKTFTPTGSNLSYTAIISNDIKLEGNFSYDEFLVTGFDSKGKKLGYVKLESRLLSYKDTQFIYLRSIQNETEDDSAPAHGIGCLMFQMLLTFIADYNKLHQDKEKLKYISGSINHQIGSRNNAKDEFELRNYYKKRSGLTDFYDRIQIVIDLEKCEKNDLFYDIQYLNQEE